MYHWYDVWIKHTAEGNEPVNLGHVRGSREVAAGLAENGLLSSGEGTSELLKRDKRKQ
jgi:hypothetical protein